MIFDPHTHTDRYSACSMISPEELILAEKRYVDGIVITDHDHLLSDKEADALSRKYDFKIFPGVEISAWDIYAHILAFGIKLEIRPDLGVEETITKIHMQDGVAVAAHPLRYVDDLDWKEWKRVDAIETLSPNCSAEQNARATEIAWDWGLPQIGSSDVHRLTMIGTYATEFSKVITNVDQLKAALLRAETKPISLRGF